MYIKVRVRANAKRESVTRIDAARFDVAVKEPPRANRANRRVIDIIAERYDLRPAQVRIVSGHQKPQKILAVETGREDGA